MIVIDKIIEQPTKIKVHPNGPLRLETPQISQTNKRNRNLTLNKFPSMQLIEDSLIANPIHNELSAEGGLNQRGGRDECFVEGEGGCVVELD